MKKILAMAAVIGLGFLAVADAGTTLKNSNYPGGLKIGRDSTGADTLSAPNKTTLDTSDVFPTTTGGGTTPHAWTKMSVFTHWYPNAAIGKDSAAVRIYFEQSVNKLWWVLVDSVSTVDTTAVTAFITPKQYEWGRFRVIALAKLDSAGAHGTLTYLPTW